METEGRRTPGAGGRQEVGAGQARRVRPPLRAGRFLEGTERLAGIRDPASLPRPARVGLLEEGVAGRLGRGLECRRKRRTVRGRNDRCDGNHGCGGGRGRDGGPGRRRGGHERVVVEGELGRSGFWRRGVEDGELLPAWRQSRRGDLLARRQKVDGEARDEREDLEGGLVQAPFLAHQLVGAQDAGDPVANHHRDEEGPGRRIPSESPAKRRVLGRRCCQDRFLGREAGLHERVVAHAEVERLDGVVAAAGGVEPERLPAAQLLVPEDEERRTRRVDLRFRQESREDVDLGAGSLDRGDGTLHESPVRGGRGAGNGDGHRLDDFLDDRLDDALRRGRRRNGVLEEGRDEVLREEVLRLRGDAFRRLGDQLVDLVPGVGQLGLPAREVILEEGREGFDKPAVGDGVDRHDTPLLEAFGAAKQHYRHACRFDEPILQPGLTRDVTLRKLTDPPRSGRPGRSTPGPKGVILRCR